MSDMLRKNIRVIAAVVVAIVLVVVNILLYSQSQAVKDEQGTVQTQYASVVANLNANRDKYDVEKLRAEEASLVGNPEFPTALPVVSLSLFLAEGAPRYQVTIESVGPISPAGSETLAGKAYPAYATRVTASGTLPKITSFLKYIEAGYFTSLKVRDVSYTAGAGTWSAAFTVVVIAQK